jgi:hypothetical protein
MESRYSESSRMRLRTLILPASLALVITALVVPSDAASVAFNPGNGTILGISGFNYANTSVLATPLQQPVVGATFDIFTETTIASTQGNSVPFGQNFNLNNSGNQFTVIAGFRETITGITAIPGGGAGGAAGPDAALINLSLASSPGLVNGTAAPNFFYVFATSASNVPSNPTANPATGSGANFANGTLVLSGFVSSPFNGSFAENGTINAGTGTFNPSITAFNPSGQATANTTPSSVSGGGGSNLTVTITNANPTFFPQGGPTSLSFQTSNSLPFTFGGAPLTGFYSGPGASPQITYPGVFPTGFDTGTVNGLTGNSLMFSGVASSEFNSAVPEPSSIIPAMTAAMGVPLFLCALRRRSKKTGA